MNYHADPDRHWVVWPSLACLIGLMFLALLSMGCATSAERPLQVSRYGYTAGPSNNAFWESYLDLTVGPEVRKRVLLEPIDFDDLEVGIPVSYYKRWSPGRRGHFVTRIDFSERIFWARGASNDWEELVFEQQLYARIVPLDKQGRPDYTVRYKFVYPPEVVYERWPE